MFPRCARLGGVRPKLGLLWGIFDLGGVVLPFKLRMSVILAGAVAVLAMAPAAHADGTLAKVGGELRLTMPAEDTTVNHTWVYRCSPSVRPDVCSQESVSFEEIAGGIQIVPATGAEDPGCTENTSFGSELWNCPAGAFTAIRVSLTGGADSFVEQVTYSAQRLTLPLALSGGDGNDSLSGTNSNDLIDGGSGSDTIKGGAGDDTLDGGIGADTVDGEAGTGDTISYAGRAEDITFGFSPDATSGGSQDGAAGARDTVTNVEGVIGGNGDDTLDAGSTGFPVTLTGGPGGDRLTAGTAAGSLIGNEGNDQLQGGNAGDTLDGGSGGDTLLPDDGADVVRAGTGVDSISAQDGVVDSLDCGGNKDSILVDPSDVVTACNDPAPPQQPSGGSNTTPTPAAPAALGTKLTFRFRAGARSTTLRKLRLALAATGATVSAKCRTKTRKRCAGTRDYKKRNAGRSLRLRGFEDRALPVGARLTFQGTKAGNVGSVKVVTIRKRKQPSVATLCLMPGARKPAACP
jgi:hypothetical protein